MGVEQEPFCWEMIRHSVVQSRHSHPKSVISLGELSPLFSLAIFLVPKQRLRYRILQPLCGLFPEPQFPSVQSGSSLFSTSMSIHCIDSFNI